MNLHRAIALTLSPITAALITSIFTLEGLDLLVGLIFLVALPPAPIVLKSIKEGKKFDPLIPDRFMRGRFFMFAVSSYSTSSLIFYVRENLIGVALSLSYLIVTMSLYLINKVITKVSVHAAGFVGPSTLLTYLGRYDVAVALWALTPLVMWSRWRSRSHSPQQLILGATLSASLTLIICMNFLPIS